MMVAGALALGLNGVAAAMPAQLPVADFATLSFNDTTDQFALVIDSNKFTGAFGDDAFIGSLAMDYRGGIPAVSGSSGGVGSVTANNGGGPNGVYDFRYKFGAGNDKLTSGESVIWTTAFDNTLYNNNAALHIQGLSGGGSLWYSTTPVPEPGMFDLMLAGIGLVGFMFYRRQRHFN